jgi:hypothetical protein
MRAPLLAKIPHSMPIRVTALEATGNHYADDLCRQTSKKALTFNVLLVWKGGTYEQNMVLFRCAVYWSLHLIASIIVGGNKREHGF